MGFLGLGAGLMKVAERVCTYNPCASPQPETVYPPVWPNTAVPHRSETRYIPPPPYACTPARDSSCGWCRSGYGGLEPPGSTESGFVCRSGKYGFRFYFYGGYYGPRE
jgi:hypothetical protein